MKNHHFRFFLFRCITFFSLFNNNPKNREKKTKYNKNLSNKQHSNSIKNKRKIIEF